MLELINAPVTFASLPTDTLVSKKTSKGKRKQISLNVWSMEGEVIKELDITGEYPEILNQKVILHIKSGLTYKIPLTAKK